MRIHREQLFLRIAYAGAPLSGKTETLKALVASLRGPEAGGEIFSPLSARGRTLYFDWVQYQGGTFREAPLHCQITSVPGQATLHHRRRLLIEEADAVVFVIDSGRDQLEANRRSLAELQLWLGRGDLPPVPVVYQANKRDLAGAMSLAEIREGMGLGSEVPIHESNALLGEGVRVCFVAAVGACVRRAEELQAGGRLPEEEPEVTTGEQLLQRLRLAEDPESGLPALSEYAGRPDARAEAPARRLAQGTAEPIAGWSGGSSRTAVIEAPPASAARPALPSTPAPAVSVVPAALPLPAPWLPGSEATLIEAWPPEIWREIRLAANPRAEPPVAAGSMLKGRIGSGWQARAWKVLDSLAEARAEWSGMVAWLQRLGTVVSSRRCVVLCRSASGWCVWQIVRQELTFDRLIRQCLEEEQLSGHAVQVLARVSTDFVVAWQELARRSVLLPIHFQTLAHENLSTVYSAFLPPAPVPRAEGDALTELARQLRSIIPAELLRTAKVTEALRELELLRETRPQLVPTVEVLQSLLIGE